MSSLECDLRLKSLDLLFHEYFIGLNVFLSQSESAAHSLLLKLSVLLGILIYFLKLFN